MKYELSEELIKAIGDNLVTQPYAQVFKLIGALQEEINSQQETPVTMPIPAPDDGEVEAEKED